MWAFGRYLVNLFTFCSCLYLGVESGILVGFVGAMAAFIFSYAQVAATHKHTD